MIYMKTIVVSKKIPDTEMPALMNTFVQTATTIIDEDCDCMTVDGHLLFRFRKNVLPQQEIESFYTNIKSFARRQTSNRGMTTGLKEGFHKSWVGTNPRVMSNIIGYFDIFSPRQKSIFRLHHYAPLINVRPCSFNLDKPEKYNACLPLIQSIDKLYSQLIPDKYIVQRQMADETHFKINDTAFTTITTNINFQTTIHCDKGDCPQGFGNLSVIQRGEYQGGYTCFPQYDIAVNVRQGDILFMDVHQAHCNLPIVLADKESIRLSIVCYLRTNIWKTTKDVSFDEFKKHCGDVDFYRKIPKTDI